MEIVLPLEKTELHKQLETLIKRYHTQDQTLTKLISDFGKEKAGYQGEQELDYYLHLSNLTDTFSFAGLRLKGDKHYFQIDRLLLTPAICFVIESKHLKGTLSINKDHQLIQQLPEQSISYDHPYTQVKLQAKQLRPILNSLGFHDLPIYPIVVFTHKRSTLNFEGRPDMIAAQQLTFRIDELCTKYPAIFQKSAITKLSQSLLKRHTIKKENVMQRYQIDPRKIQTGVLCKHCKTTKVQRIHGTWQCHRCKRRDAEAHVEALSDYKHLFNPLITSKQARWFLEVESRYTVHRLLTQLKLPVVGVNKSTHYNLSKLK